MSGDLHSARETISCPSHDPNCTRITETVSAWNNSRISAYRLVDLNPVATSVSMVEEAPDPFPTVDVPDHAHYTIGAFIFVVGIIGLVGNFLVIYAFSRSRTLRTPANMFIINLAITDFLMCLTQAPIFFTTSMHKRWIFGETACELYAFCGALFGICSMITLTVIAVDRYFVITRPLASIGVVSCKRALLILGGAWVYSLGWSLPPFFGWSAYIPEGFLTSCTWDYMTFTPSVRAYTMLLFCFVFFIPLIIIIYCYIFIFRAIRNTNNDVSKINGNNTRDSIKKFHRLKNEWRMAKIAFIAIMLFVISWSPYSAVALTAFAGYSDMLTPYMNSVPAVIAKASAIHNPIIYAITHPKYRSALAKYIPCLGSLLCVPPRELRSIHSSFASTRRSTVTSQSSDISTHFRRTSSVKPRLSSASDSESGWTDTEADLSSCGSRPVSRQVSCDISKDTAELPDVKLCSSASLKAKLKKHDSGIFESKLKNHDSGIFEKTSSDIDDISVAGAGHPDRSLPPGLSVAAPKRHQQAWGMYYSRFIPNSWGGDFADGVVSGVIGRIPSIVITSESSPFLSSLRFNCRSNGSRLTNGSVAKGSVTADIPGSALKGSALPSASDPAPSAK